MTKPTMLILLRRLLLAKRRLTALNVFLFIVLLFMISFILLRQWMNYVERLPYEEGAKGHSLTSHDLCFRPHLASWHARSPCGARSICQKRRLSLFLIFKNRRQSNMPYVIIIIAQNAWGFVAKTKIQGTLKWNSRGKAYVMLTAGFLEGEVIRDDSCSRWRRRRKTNFLGQIPWKLENFKNPKIAKGKINA